MVGNGLLVAELGSFNTQFLCLRVDALGGGALFVEIFVGVALTVKLVAQSGAFGSSHRGHAAPLAPISVSDGAGLAIGLWKKEGAGIAPLLVFDFGSVASVG